MTALPFVSVIIPTYNRGNLLPLTIESFLAQSYPPDRYEILISNNKSTDNTQILVDQYCKKHPMIKSLYEDRQGVHYARNSAAKIARGDILYFTDDDMVADRNLLEELIKVFELDSGIGTATGLIIGKFDSEPPAWVKKNMSSQLSLTVDWLTQIDLLVSRGNFDVASCHQAIRRDAFFEGGGFNPENTAGIWIGDGEVGLNIRLRKLGYKYAYTSRSVIYHLIPASRTTFRYLLSRVANQAFSDSCTAYREHKNKKMIIPNMVKRTTVLFPTRLVSTTGRVATGKLSWRFIPALLVYYYKRSIYDWKLYRNEKFRKTVEIDDWLTNEPVIKF
jgi:glycosyltransferase involved in cell wall biosynthesis